MSEPSFTVYVDVSNPEGLAHGVEQVLENLETAKQEFAKAQAAVQHWTAMYDRLRLLAGDTDQSEAPSIRTQVIEVVNSRGRPTKAAHVASALGPGVERGTINWSLWDAARSGKIRRIMTGTYVPLTYTKPLVEAMVELAQEEIGGAANAQIAADSRRAPS